MLQSWYKTNVDFSAHILLPRRKNLIYLIELSTAAACDDVGQFDANAKINLAPFHFNYIQS